MQAVAEYHRDLPVEHARLAFDDDGFDIDAHIFGDDLGQVVQYAYAVHSGDIEGDTGLFLRRVYPFGGKHPVSVVGKHIGGVQAIFPVDDDPFAYAYEPEYVVSRLRTAARSEGIVELVFVVPEYQPVVMRFFFGVGLTGRPAHDGRSAQQVGKEPPARYELFEGRIVHQALSEAVEHILRVLGFQEGHQVVDRLFAQVYLQMFKLAFEYLAAVFGRFPHVLVQGGLYLVAGPGSLDEFQPLGFGFLVFSGDDFHLVAALQDIVQRD